MDVQNGSIQCISTTSKLEDGSQDNLSLVDLVSGLSILPKRVEIAKEVTTSYQKSEHQLSTPSSFTMKSDEHPNAYPLKSFESPLLNNQRFDQCQEEEGAEQAIDSYEGKNVSSDVQLLLKSGEKSSWKDRMNIASSLSVTSSMGISKESGKNNSNNNLDIPSLSLSAQKSRVGSIMITSLRGLGGLEELSRNNIEERAREEEVSEEDEASIDCSDDIAFEPRPKANTFTSGYISAMVPCEQKKSLFGMKLNLNLKSSYAIPGLEDSEQDGGELADDSKDYDSTDEMSSTYSITPQNGRSEFARRRSKFFKTFKQESLKLITIPQKIEKKEQTMMHINKEKFDEKFQLQEKVGEGCHAVVRRCSKKDDSPFQSYAVKIIAYRDQEYLFEILQEERVLSLLKHRNIIKYDSFYLEKEKKRAYIVSEFAEGRSLGHFFQAKKVFSTREIRYVTKQILRGIAHMHSKGIVHRDLSYNNIMYDPSSECIKIIDFTVSKIVTIQKLLTNTGTLQFKAPEMLSGSFYSHPIDLWAVGVNIFALIFGFLPFETEGSTMSEVVTKILHHNPFEDIRSKPQYDPLLVHFLEGLLERNPLKRMTAQQALKHPWIDHKLTGEDFLDKRSKIFRSRKQLHSKKGIASTAADLDQEDEKSQKTDTITSFNKFIIKTLINLQDD